LPGELPRRPAGFRPLNQPDDEQDEAGEGYQTAGDHPERPAEVAFGS